MLSCIKTIFRIMLPICLTVAVLVAPVMAQTPSGWVDRYGQLIDRDPAGPDGAPHLVPPVSAEGSQPGVSAPQAGSIFKPYKYITLPGASANAVGIGDFNSDGLNDVAVTDDFNGTGLWVFLQKADGSLASPARYATGSRPETLAVGDLNYDGRTDIAIANFSGNTLGVFLQKADGTLSPQVTYPTSTGPDAIVIADLNHDGRDDVAVSHWNSSVLGVFYQQVNGTLAAMTSYPAPLAGWDDIDVGDLNHDGLTDIVKMNGQGYANPNLSVYLQKPGGGFANPASYDLGDINGGGAAVGDVTGDGLDDIALAYGGNKPSSNLAIFAQNTSGLLDFQTTYPSYDIPEPVEVADIDLDGRKDVLTVHGGWNALGIYPQRVEGGLEAEQLYSLPYASHYGPQGLDVGDINGDGGPDVVIGDYNYGLVILYNALVPDFSLSAMPNSQMVKTGKSAQMNVIISGIVGFDVPVDLTIEGLPVGVTAELSPNPATPNSTAVLTLTAEPRAPAGIYTLKITGVGGKITRAINVNIKVVQTITGLSASNNGPTQLGSATLLKASVATGSNVTVSWDFGDGKKGSNATTLHTYSAVGTYTATATAKNEVGSVQVSTIVSVVDVPITGMVVYAQNPALVQMPTTLMATITAGTNVRYHWEFDDGTTSDGASVSHTYTQVGLHPVKVTASNSTGSQTQMITLLVTTDSLPYSTYIPSLHKTKD